MIKLKRSAALPFFFLILAVLGLLCFPKAGSDKLRTWAIGIISPSSPISTPTSDVSTLEAENQRMREQIDRFQEWLLSEERLEGLWQQLFTIAGKSEDPYFERRSRHLSETIHNQLHALPAKVIFREPSTWSGNLWLNVGQKDNRKLGREIIVKNSPVVIGKTVVGVVELVEEKRCSVRLLTDPALTPSVRVVRGGEQNRILFERIEALTQVLAKRGDLFGAKEITEALSSFKGQLQLDEKALYLAKGFVQGSGAPLWRSQGQILIGKGFNYDFADAEGPARNLRSGLSQDGIHDAPLIKTGDLLVTTGMDGVFPPDLHVGIVQKILPLREGGCSYELEACSLIPHFDHLSEVYVLPPI